MCGTKKPGVKMTTEQIIEEVKRLEPEGRRRVADAIRHEECERMLLEIFGPPGPDKSTVSQEEFSRLVDEWEKATEPEEEERLNKLILEASGESEPGHA